MQTRKQHTKEKYSGADTYSNLSGVVIVAHNIRVAWRRKVTNRGVAPRLLALAVSLWLMVPVGNFACANDYIQCEKTIFPLKEDIRKQIRSLEVAEPKIGSGPQVPVGSC